MLRRHRLALAVAALFIALGTFYSIIDPVFEASDELNHYPYVQYLAQGHGLPVQRPGQETLWGQEGSQPPLYYALAAALTGWIDTSDLPDLLYLNPHADRGIPASHDNKNMIVHSEREAWPWRGTTLAVHLIRLFSVLLGAGTVLCTYRLALDIMPQRPGPALAATAVNAGIPMFLFISASVNNDNLVIFLSSLALVLMVRQLQAPQPGAAARFARARLVLLGVVLGLACLAKLSALGLLPLAAVALAWPRWRTWSAGWRPNGDGARRSLVRQASAWVVDCLWVFVPVVLVAGWWYMRNWQLYGDPTGLNVMLAIAGRRRVPVNLFGLLDEFDGFRFNFWGLFGGVNVLMRPGWVYAVLDGLTLASLGGLAYGAGRARRAARPAPAPGTAGPYPALALLIAWIALEMASLVRWTMATSASQGRLLFPTLPALCLFFVLGLAAWLPVRARTPALAAVAGLLACLALAEPLAAIAPAYPPPTANLSAGVPAGAHPVNMDFGGAIRLLAYETDRDTVQPGGRLTVTYYWQALRPLDTDYSVSAGLLSARQTTIAQHDTYPAGGSYPTHLWAPGQVVRDRHVLDIRPEALGPTPAWLMAGVYKYAGRQGLSPANAQGQLIEFPALTTVRVEAPEPTLLPSHPLAANFNGQVQLIGYDLDTPRLAPGGEIRLALYWQVAGKLDRSYKVFVHLVDAGGEMAGQGDGLPLGGFYPTQAWQPGEILADAHTIKLATSLAPGPQRLEVGFYDVENGQRLGLLDKQGRPAGDQVEIVTLSYP